jgi:hypothetical protein
VRGSVRLVHDSANRGYNSGMAHLSFFFFGPRRVALDPLHEPAQRMLMLLYAQAGQQRRALRQYDTCRERLVSELGVPPRRKRRTRSSSVSAAALTNRFLSIRSVPTCLAVAPPTGTSLSPWPCCWPTRAKQRRRSSFMRQLCRVHTSAILAGSQTLPGGISKR